MCPIYRGVRLIESEIKGVKKDKGHLYVSDLQRCPLRESEIKGIKKDNGPTVYVRFTEVSVL